MIGATAPNGYDISRIGKESPNYHRYVKVNVHVKMYCDAIINEAKKLKDVNSPWDNIYMKKDLHPAVIQENNRLRVKMRGLRI